MIIGIGARRGVNKEEVISAIEAALAEAGMKSDDIDMFASSTLKENETGLLEAVNVLGKEIKFLSEEEINLYEAPSGSQANRFGLTGVAEPSALALSKKKELILRKKVYGRITIAIAE
ncbi:cobalamin biosynthesis protein CbiG [Methanomethylovorans hollandica DSM 15978]|jgi:cobalt-precorrin 5A hydrolase|uniref:Cobalamin biosynthesis protein CbiG n=1 Tax=Methanomethylovorans hollandica (strain DSM 15978 / NBRC 107637 / DMS1) TaxID=867904 RepID=L0L0A2_METHD|nr:cobalamin biosynthesis protein [Methanomethylovorans hollandica]AGB50355.1 cobalamin biosynthesis protein CbiG [Methanomethylovorans hollandica DSM 15978]